MLFAAQLEAKIVVLTVAATVALVVLVIYLPGTLVREVTRPEGEALPGWMGTVKGRRTRLRVMLTIIGVAVVYIAAVRVFGG